MSLIQNSSRGDKTQQLILVDLSKAFGSVGRNVRRAIIYQQGLRWEAINQIRMGHDVGKLCAKHDGYKGNGYIIKEYFKGGR